MMPMPLRYLCFILGAIDLVRTQPGGEGGSGHSYKCYYCTGKRGAKKAKKLREY